MRTSLLIALLIVAACGKSGTAPGYGDLPSDDSKTKVAVTQASLEGHYDPKVVQAKWGSKGQIMIIPARIWFGKDGNAGPLLSLSILDPKDGGIGYCSLTGGVDTYDSGAIDQQIQNLRMIFPRAVFQVPTKVSIQLDPTQSRFTELVAEVTGDTGREEYFSINLVLTQKGGDWFSRALRKQLTTTDPQLMVSIQSKFQEEPSQTILFPLSQLLGEQSARADRLITR